MSPPPEGPAQPATPGEGAPEVFLRTFATPVVFALIALGFHFFLRGHNAPGGGFIAGLVVAVAALLARMARDQRLLRIRAELLVPAGLAVALLTGVVPMVFGAPFLESDYGYLDWPLIGEFEWATAVAFDAGVFLVVVGTTITIIDLLAEDRHLREIGFAGVGGDDAPETPMAAASDDAENGTEEDAEEDAETGAEDGAADDAEGGAEDGAGDEGDADPGAGTAERGEGKG